MVDISKYYKYITYLIISVGLGILYDRYKLHQQTEENMESYDIVQKYLLNDSSLATNKPILWIHNTYDINARDWISFYSRNSTDLNQPYLMLTIKSIVDKNGADCNICLIDDDSFSKLIPDWAIDLNLVADPVKSKIRQLALAKLLFYYGGFVLPSSFICFKPLKSVYEQLIDGEKMFVGELVDRNSTSQFANFFANTKFMGCSKGSTTMQAYTSYLETLISRDFTSESDFLGAYGRWCNEKVISGEINMIPASMLGVKDIRGAVIGLERLINNSFVELSRTALGLYIPADDIIKRTAYQWFARLSAKQALASDTMIGKYLLLSNSTI
jgi:hypothetical protein